MAQVQKLEPPQSEWRYHQFGFTLDAEERRLLVGTGWIGKGMAFAYERTPAGVWTLHHAAAAHDSEAFSFGSGVALMDHRFVVGAPGEDLSTSTFGAIYEFDPWNGAEVELTCEGAENSTGEGARLRVDGLVSVDVDELGFRIRKLPADQTAVLFYGPNQIDVPFGDGRLCVGAPQYRVAAGSSPSGHLDLPFDFDAPPSPAAQVEAGSTWHFQVWYRDPAAGGTGVNLTNGVRVVFCP